MLLPVELTEFITQGTAFFVSIAVAKHNTVSEIHAKQRITVQSAVTCLGQLDGI